MLSKQLRYELTSRGRQARQDYRDCGDGSLDHDHSSERNINPYDEAIRLNQEGRKRQPDYIANQMMTQEEKIMSGERSAQYKAYVLSVGFEHPDYWGCI